MLRPLIDLLHAHRDDAGECLARLLAWAPGAVSPVDLELDLRTLQEAGILDGGLAGRLLAALEELDRGGSAPGAAAGPPELAALESEVGALEARHLEVDGRHQSTLRLEREIASASRQVADLDARIEKLRGDVAAAVARCEDRQAKLEGTNDERREPVLA